MNATSRGDEMRALLQELERELAEARWERSVYRELAIALAAELKLTGDEFVELFYKTADRLRHPELRP